jgi:hypothetical protein
MQSVCGWHLLLDVGDHCLHPVRHRDLLISAGTCCSMHPVRRRKILHYTSSNHINHMHSMPCRVLLHSSRDHCIFYVHIMPSNQVFHHSRSNHCR